MRLFKTPRFLRRIYSHRTWGFSSHDKTIYLTFDDGPNPDITPFILDELKKTNWKATFFCVGENVKKYPEIYQRILKEGHQTGNHTFKHENAIKVSQSEYLSSIEAADSYISSPLFRPPYGRLTPKLARKISRNYHIIMWSWLSYDFDQSISVDEILKKAKSIQAGDILVLHDNSKIASKQKELLPQLIDVLIKKGFESKKIH